MRNPHLEERLAYGKEQLQIGNYGRVERVANELLNSNDPEFKKDGLLYKGMALSFQGNSAEALEYFNQAIEAFPDFEFAYYYRLENLYRLGQVDEARADAAHLIELDNSNPIYFEKLIAIDLAMEKFESVEALCDRALEAEPNGMEFIAVRADVKLKQKKYQAAVDDFLLLENSEEFDFMDKANIYNNAGFANIKLENYAAAKPLLEKALEVNPNAPFAINNLGYTLTHLDEMEKGVELINDSIDMYPENSYAFLFLAKAAIELGEIDDAIECLEQAQELEHHVHYDDEANELLEKLRAS